MTEERFKEIWNAIVVNAFYCAGCSGNGGSDISHAEMVELMNMSKAMLNGESKKHLKVWWKEDGHRLSGIVLENIFKFHNDGIVTVKMDNSIEIRYVKFKEVDATDWIDDKDMK